MVKKVLVIDDEEDLTFFLKSNLEMRGEYEVFTAYDGQEGLVAANRHKPDLVILDVMMPKMDGFQVLERLKQQEETLNIPVIMLTAKAKSDDIDRGLTSGADFYLPKPFTIDNLTDFIELTLSGKGA
jgi:DNA-binding response OmpR family regulator